MPLHAPCPWVPPPLPSVQFRNGRALEAPPCAEKEGDLALSGHTGACAGSAKAGGQVQRVLSCKGLGSQLGSLSSGPLPLWLLLQEAAPGQQSRCWVEGGWWLAGASTRNVCPGMRLLCP